MFIIPLLVFLIILTVLVLIHELGHFLVARKFNIKVEEFGVGFPPRAWSKKIGETIYSINWLPIGGFVKLYGEDDAGGGSIKLPKSEQPKKDLDRAFFTKPVWQRAAVVVAGVVMNVLLAIVIYYIFLGLSNFKTSVPLIGDYKFFGVNQAVKESVLIYEVSKDSPAEKAGIESTDKIVAINGEKIITNNQFMDLIRENKGKEIMVTWQDAVTGVSSEAKITPRTNAPKGEGALGVSFNMMSDLVLHYDTPVQKVFSGIIHPANLLVYNLDVLGKIIGVSIQERTAEPIGGAVAGPVGIFKVVEEFLTIPDMKQRVLKLLDLAGLLSISLALFNILPIPALDGGRLFFILIEGITGKKVNQKYETLAHTVGMIVLLGLMVLIVFKDIFQFILPQ